METRLNQNNQMLSYCKTILEKMSFDRRLLMKEYKKSLKWLSEPENQELKVWMRSKKETGLISKNGNFD